MLDENVGVDKKQWQVEPICDLVKHVDDFDRVSVFRKIKAGVKGGIHAPAEDHDLDNENWHPHVLLALVSVYKAVTSNVNKNY